MLVAEYFCRANEIGHDDVIVQGDGTIRVENSPHFFAHRQYLRKLIMLVTYLQIQFSTMIRVLIANSNRGGKKLKIFFTNDDSKMIMVETELCSALFVFCHLYINVVDIEEICVKWKTPHISNRNKNHNNT